MGRRHILYYTEVSTYRVICFFKLILKHNKKIIIRVIMKIKKKKKN